MNLFELFVKIGVDDQASGKLSNLSSKLGNGLKTAAKIGTAAVTAAAAGITALTKAAVDNYAEYEQLIGGVETLYGAKYKTIEEYIEGTGAAAEYAEQTFAEYQKRQQAVLDNAANAYKTAGMSANEYMNTVNGFAASLTNSLGEYEWQAANYADMIVSDMADNANKMGTSMDMIQNAYAGFAKQNYTMLDNLKLGYGGTKTEMERLLRDAERMAGYVEGSLDIESFADIADAIHIVQEEMGITGTTALEAGRTISGSVGAMKSAWTNLITGLADGNADIGQLVDNLVTTIVGDGTEANLGVLGNVMPAIKTALNGAARLVSELLPVVVAEIPAIISENLPVLASAAVSVIQSLADGISQNSDLLIGAIFDAFDSIISEFPALIKSFTELIPDLLDSILEELPGAIESIISALTDGGVIESLTEAVVEIVQSIADNLPSIIQSIVDAIPRITESVNNAILNNFPALLQAIIQIVLTIVQNLPSIIQMLVDQIGPIVSTIVQVLMENLPTLIAGVAQIIFELVKAIPSLTVSLFDSIISIFEGIGNGVVNAWPKFKEGMAEIWGKLTKWIGEKWDGVKDWGKDLIDNFISGIKQKWENLKKTVSDVAQSVKDFLGFSEPKKGPLSNFHTYAPDMMDLFAKGIRDNEDVVTDQIEKSFDFGERTMKFGAEYGGGYGVASAGGAFGGTSIGSITINIDGAKYSDEQSLASAIALEIQNMTDRRAAVYA